MTGPMVPTLCRVRSRHDELPDTVTLDIEFADATMAAMRPGQFNMLWAIGVGEVPISATGGLTAVAADRDDSGPMVLRHTIRAVGAATTALCALQPGDLVGVRGPFGTDWGIDDPALDDHHVVFIAGGLGFAPLRAAVEAAGLQRSRFSGCSLLVGARTPDTILYLDDIAAWRAAGIVDVDITVDRATGEWGGPVGVVTERIALVDLDPERTVAFVCGPEVMMKHTGESLLARGVPAQKIRLSLERNMKCAVAMCGHCQLGAQFICHDGPVFTYDRVAPLLQVPEL